MEDKVVTVSKVVDEEERYNHAVDLDHALDIAGLGSYNLKFCFVLAIFLIAAIMEAMGYSYVLPAGKCDLSLSDSQRGLISSLPYIGVVATSFIWGFFVDTRGRRQMVILSSTVAGTLGIVGSFMPEITSFALVKFLGALCMACPAAAPYTFIGEILPRRYRDLALSVTNALQMLGAGLVPLIAWAILSLDFQVDFGSYEFRPWRLLSIIYSSSFLVGAFFMYFGPESPKYLISQGKHDEALLVLQTIYAKNHGKNLEDFPVKHLSIGDEKPKKKESFFKILSTQTVPLMKPPYVKWLLLNGFLLFGIFGTVNGLYMWVPDVLNRVLTGSAQPGLTACQIIGQRNTNQTGDDAICDDSIATQTFVINSIANVSCAFIALAASVTVKIIGKKALLVIVYWVLGVFCILINVLTNNIVFAVLLTSLQLTALGIGPINAYGVEIFPTHLRGMAIGLGLMFGRTGSIVGTNVAGVLINSYCEVNFYMFGALLLLCGCLTFLLPKPLPTNKTVKGF